MRRNFISFAIISVAGFAITGCSVQSVGSSGDSLTAGVLAAYPMTQPVDFKVVDSLLPNFLSFIITRNDSNLRMEEYSWSTGSRSDVGSVFTSAGRYSDLQLLVTLWKSGRLNEPSRENCNLNTECVTALADKNRSSFAFNAAKTGAVAADLSKQIEAIHAESLSKIKRNYPDLVTIFIGANDICNDTSSAEHSLKMENFRNNLSGVISKIHNTQPDTIISIARFSENMAAHYKTFSSEKNVAVETHLGSGKLISTGTGKISLDLLFPGKSATCGNVWEKFQMDKTICPLLLSKENQTKVDGVQKVISDFNSQIDEVKRQADLHLSKGSRSKIVIFDAPPLRDSSHLNIEDSIEPKDLALDCFHLSGSGQAKLAKRAKDSLIRAGY